MSTFVAKTDDVQISFQLKTVTETMIPQTALAIEKKQKKEEGKGQIKNERFDFSCPIKVRIDDNNNIGKG